MRWTQGMRALRMEESQEGMTDSIERFIHDLGGWPDEAVDRRRRERLEKLLAEARAAALSQARSRVSAAMYDWYVDTAAALAVLAALEEKP